jgi:hypothetical protein
MNNSPANARLHLVLRIDAIASGASGVLLLIGGQVLADLFGIPTGLLVPVGFLLLAYAAALWFTETRPNLNASAVQAIVAANALWIVTSVLVVVLGWFPLTGLGVAFVLTQAAAVAILADLEFTSLRQVTARTAARA